MNYALYILAAYIISFCAIGYMFTSSYNKYRRAQREFAKMKAARGRKEQAQPEAPVV